MVVIRLMGFYAHSHSPSLCMQRQQQVTRLVAHCHQCAEVHVLEQAQTHVWLYSAQHSGRSFVQLTVH